MNPKLKYVVTEAATAVYYIDWQKSLVIDAGACIPIAVFGAAFLTAAGIPARVVEAGARFIDPLSPRYAEIATSEPALEARNEPGLLFLGHCVIQVPTHRAVFDLSLPSQGTVTIRNLGAPHVLMGNLDHTKGQEGFQTNVGRGQATYRIYPRRDGWRKRNWPYEEIKDLAVMARLQQGEFAFLKED